MTAQAAKQLNQIPRDGTAPDLSVPVTAAQVISMVKADSGVEFKPNEVTISPTGAACSLMGGAFVYVLPTGRGPGTIPAEWKMDFIVGRDGKLVNYGRDPFF